MVKMCMGGKEVQPLVAFVFQDLRKHARRIVKCIEDEQHIVHADEKTAVQ